MEGYIQSIAINGTGTGHKINTTLLVDFLADPSDYYEEYLETGQLPALFLPADGMAIDAELVENYLYEHFYEEPTEAGYTMFLLNYSNFDSLDHQLEHWYTIESINIDSNRTVSWFQPWNTTDHSATAWGGKHRFCFLDLTARSWYIDLLAHADLSPFTVGQSTGNYIYYQYPDLDNLTQTFDPHTTEGQKKLAAYISQSINSFMGNLIMVPPIMSSPPLGRSIAVPIKIFDNLTNNGYSKESLRWCISAERILNRINHDIPWIDWDVSIEWVNLEDYPDLVYWFNQNAQTDPLGQRFVEISNGLLWMLHNQLDYHFDRTTADDVLPCYFFLTKDLQFTNNGQMFDGLGGMGFELMVRSQNRLFEGGDSTKPASGMTRVLIHELGHSLGLPHPHSSTYGWVSSFVADVMSYFTRKTNVSFSCFYQDALGRLHGDAQYLSGLDEINAVIDQYEIADVLEGFQEEIDQIFVLLAEGLEKYRQMDYYASIFASRKARALIEELTYLIETPTSTVVYPTPPVKQELWLLVSLAPLFAVTVRLVQKKRKLEKKS